MNSAAICVTLLVLLAPSAASAQPAEPRTSPIASADRLFQTGEFAQAAEQYARIAADHPDDYLAMLGFGRVALLVEPPDEAAESWLKKAVALRPGEADPKVMLAEVYYRCDDFEKAAASLSGIDVRTIR